MAWILSTSSPGRHLCRISTTVSLQGYVGSMKAPVLAFSSRADQPLALATDTAGSILEENWRHYGAATMAVTLSIKHAPDEIVRRLRERARRNHRSLQGELMSILEHAVAPERGLSPAEVLEEVRRRGLQTPSEAAELIRAGRDSR
jgi:plasmid stability protein